MEILLGLIIIVQAVYVAYLEFQFKNERRDLLKAIMAKNLTDYTTSTIIEKDTSKPVTEKEPDFIPLEQADDKLFDEAIKL